MYALPIKGIGKCATERDELWKGTTFGTSGDEWEIPVESKFVNESFRSKSTKLNHIDHSDQNQIVLSAQNSQKPLKSLPNKRLARVVKYYKFKRNLKKQVLASLIHDHGPNDPRPYMNITIASEKFDALLDSGASVSVLSQGALEFLKEINLKYKKLNSFVQTAEN